MTPSFAAKTTSGTRTSIVLNAPNSNMAVSMWADDSGAVQIGPLGYNNNSEVSTWGGGTGTNQFYGLSVFYQGATYGAARRVGAQYIANTTGGLTGTPNICEWYGASGAVAYLDYYAALHAPTIAATTLSTYAVTSDDTFDLTVANSLSITFNAAFDSQALAIIDADSGTALVIGGGSMTVYSDANFVNTMSVTALYPTVIYPGVIALTDGATISTNAYGSNEFSVTLGGNRTMAAPTGGNNGQTIRYAIKQDGTGSRTISWNSIFRFSGGTPPTLTTAANKTDYIEFRYNSLATKWDCTATGMNF